MAIKKAVNIDPYKIEGTFKHGGYMHFGKKDYIYLVCASVLFLGLGSIMFFYELFVAIMIETAFFVLFLGLAIFMLSNLKMWKDMIKWMDDAVELTVIPEYVEGDSIFVTFLPQKVEAKLNLQEIVIQVRFKLNGRMHCVCSKRLPMWQKYVGQETTILYSEKYNQVIVMKLPILSEE